MFYIYVKCCLISYFMGSFSHSSVYSDEFVIFITSKQNDCLSGCLSTRFLRSIWSWMCFFILHFFVTVEIWFNHTLVYVIAIIKNYERKIPNFIISIESIFLNNDRKYSTSTQHVKIFLHSFSIALHAFMTLQLDNQ